VGFCSGFHNEVKRQATLDNNILLFRKAEENVAAYVDEGLVIAARDGFTKATPAWVERGGKVAGKEFWDGAPLLDTPGQPPMRTMIVAMRSRFADACDKMAVQSAAFHDQAEALKQPSLAPAPTPAKKKAKQQPLGRRRRQRLIAVHALDNDSRRRHEGIRGLSVFLTSREEPLPVDSEAIPSRPNRCGSP
jgi:hypothetical protein